MPAIIDKNHHPLQKGQRVAFSRGLFGTEQDGLVLGTVQEVSNIDMPIFPGSKEYIKRAILMVILPVAVPANAPIVPIVVTHEAPVVEEFVLTDEEQKIRTAVTEAYGIWVTDEQFKMLREKTKAATAEAEEEVKSDILTIAR